MCEYPARVQVNTAKQKMRAGQPAYGLGLGLGSPLAAELLSRSGIDWLLLDTQHGAWGHDGAIAALMAMGGGSATPMARVAKNDYFLIGKLLDQGALGIVVPMVDTPELARAAADACRLPPHGTRSWGVGRASIYGNDYFDWINEQVFVGIQIESIQAVERAEAIMATPGIDGCWAGPADLALSMGLDPRKAGDDDRHGQALEQILAACRNTGKVPGLACASPDEARRRAEHGWQFLTAGSDAGFMMGAVRTGLGVLGL
jgi:4-hydroxy-2-oxoheptanedioate aldolase